ncbi:hypothetical protein BKA62DRAFT_766801 [Auriculariales sp. MPI-PUGE-AT-0066]|nr:hypothetical protein BKA62DRAFT_766801 [Auriculariales sp. MPI-PUGE-AT-0066]
MSDNSTNNPNPAFSTLLTLAAFVIPGIAVVLVCVIVVVLYRLCFRNRMPRDPPTSLYMAIRPPEPTRPPMHDVWLGHAGEKAHSGRWEGVEPLFLDVWALPVTDEHASAFARTPLPRRAWPWRRAPQGMPVAHNAAAQAEKHLATANVGVLIQLPSPVRRDTSLEDQALVLGIGTVPYRADSPPPPPASQL